MEVPLEEIFEDDEAKIIINNTGENSGVGSGGYNTNYNIPNSIIENLQDYIALLKKEIETLKANMK